jgi:hypothetical protein
VSDPEREGLCAISSTHLSRRFSGPHGSTANATDNPMLLAATSPCLFTIKSGRKVGTFQGETLPDGILCDESVEALDFVC